MSAPLRAGYKQTEAGVIPQAWDVADLQKVCAEKITYGIVQCGPHVENGVPYIRVSDMNSPVLDVSGMLRTSQVIASQFSRSQVKEGDVVYALRGKIGEVRNVDQSVAGANLTQGTARLSPSSRMDSTYLLYCLRSQVALRQGDLAAKGSTFREITLESLRQIQLAIAPLPEQRAIAAALSDVDALLAKLDAFIAKKRDLKQATMQQLLTGQTRLPGFSGEWEVKRLDALADIRSGGTPSTTQPEFWNGDVLWCTPTDITALSGFKYLSHTSRTITSRGLQSSSAELIPAGSIVMTSRATIGECAINAVPVATNQGFKNFVPYPGTNGEFLYYLLQTKKQDFIGLCSGSTFLEIGKTQLVRFEIKIPDKVEQTTIATILSDIDTELAALEARRDKTRALKQGMMQELLTGRIRLV